MSGRAALDGSLWQLPAIRRLVAVTLLGFTGFAATLAALPWWATQGGAGIQAAGLVTTAMLATTVATQTLVPAIVHRAGAGRSLAVGLLVLGAPAPLYLVSTDLWALVAVSAVRGVGFALLTVVGSTLTWTISPPGRHGEAAGLYGLAIGAASVAVVPGAVVLAQQVGIWAVVLLATLPVLAAPWALAVQDARPVAAGDPNSTGTPAEVAVPGPHPVWRVLVPCLVLLVVTLAGSGLVTFLSIERPTGALAPVALLLFGATSAVARWRVGIAADRVGSQVLLPGAVLLTAVGLAGVSWALVVPADILLLCAAAVGGTGYGAVQNLTLVVAFARVDEAGKPTASAVWNLSYDAGTAIGAVAVGVLAAAAAAGPAGGSGIPVALGACAALVALALPLALRSTTSRADLHPDRTALDSGGGRHR